MVNLGQTVLVSALTVVIVGLLLSIGRGSIVALGHAISYRKHGDMHKATRHQEIMRGNVYKVLVVVLLAEVLVQIVGARGLGPLFWVHLAFAVPFLISLLVLSFLVTGFHSPGLHRVLGYSCLVLFLATTATGVPMLFRLIQR